MKQDSASCVIRRQRFPQHGTLVLLLLVGLLASNVCAQLYTGSLAGVVTDPSGAVVPSASVVLTDVAKGFKYKTQADATGRYLLRPLPPATYELSVEASGFRRAVRSGIVLNVDQSANIDVSLQLASTDVSVEVQAAAPLMATQDATTGQTVDRLFINNLPLIGRGITDLTFLAPGVNPAPGWTYGSIKGLWTNNDFTSNGGRNATSDSLVDGITSSGYQDNTAVQTVIYTPSVDAVQEFHVQQNNFSAEFGFSSNTVLNVVTRSGTNRFHGSVYEFLRNEKLDANGWFNNANDIALLPLRYNNFGATVGGPIQKDKTFFFVDYEGNRSHSMGSGFTIGVPSAAERQGDFGELCGYAGGSFTADGRCNAPGGAGQIWDPYSGVYDPNAGGAVRSSYIPFNNLANYQSPGNPKLNGTGFQLPARPGNLIDPVAAKIMSFYPLPNLNVGSASYDPYKNWTGNGITATSHDQFDIKIDRRFGDHDTLSGRFSYGRDPSNGGPSCYHNALDPCSVGTFYIGPRALALNYTHIFTPTTTLSVSGGFVRNWLIAPGVPADYPQFDPVKDLGLPGYMATSGYKATPSISIGGGYYNGPLNSIGGEPWSVGYDAMETYHIVSVIDHVHGRHQFKFGAEMRLHRLNGGGGTTPGGYFSFDYNTTSEGPNYGGGDAMAGFLTGVSTTGWGQYQTIDGLAFRNTDWAGYLQDDFRVNDKLTLNLGLRYELDIPRSERYDRQAWFDPALASPVGDVPGLGQMHGGLVYAGKGYPRTVADTNYRGIMPRVGLAYRVAPEMVLRAGYGIFSNVSQFTVSSNGATPGGDGFNATTNWVTTYLGDGATPWGRLSDPFPSGLVSSTGRSLGAMTNVGNGISEYLRGNNALPYTQTWSAGLQYKLPGGVVADANYVGTKGTHLYFGNAGQLNHLGPSVEKASPAQLADLLSLVDNPFYGIITDPNAPLSYPQVQKMQLLYPFPQYTSVWTGPAPAANSIYHAFQLRLEKRLSAGLQFLVNYTNSKSIDTASVGTNTGWLGGTASLIDPNNWGLERSVSEYDIPQVLNVAYVYNLPFGKKRRWGSNWNRWVDGLLGGWQTNGMWRFDNGQPLSLGLQGGLALPGGYGQRPDLIGQLHVNPRSKWFCSDPGCGYFSNQGATPAPSDVAVVPADYTLGTAPRLLPNVRRPGTNTGALSLFKEFSMESLREGARMEFRAEAFNALNHPQFCGPNTTVNGGNFGQITCQANSPREVQVALKLYW